MYPGVLAISHSVWQGYRLPHSLESSLDLSMAILASHHPETPAIAPPNDKLARSAAYILNDIGTS
jgi:hypothetical protein